MTTTANLTTFDTQPLYLNANLRVVSTVCPRDMTVPQPLHNMAITDELTRNLALAEISLIHFATFILQRLSNSLLTKRDDVVWHFL